MFPPELFGMEDVKITKPIKYLSPSSYSEYLKRPNFFFLRRLTDVGMDKEPQNQAAANGSAFDCLVKQYLLEQELLKAVSDTSVKRIQELEKSVEIVDPEAKELAWARAKHFFLHYKLHGLPKLSVEFMDAELWKEFTFRDVKIFAKLDATCKYNQKIVPFDWKLFGSESHSSPSQGYARIVDDGKLKPAHKKHREDIAFEEIDETIAHQLCVYGWSLGFSHKEWEEFPAVVHEVTITESKKVRIAELIGNITVNFQQKFYKELYECWREVNNANKIFTRIESQDFMSLNYWKALRESWF